MTNSLYQIMFLRTSSLNAAEKWNFEIILENEKLKGWQ